MVLNELLETTIRKKASDLHLVTGIPPVLRVNGSLIRMDEAKLAPNDTEKFAQQILGDDFDSIKECGEKDLSYSLSGLGRFRVNVYKQRGTFAMAIRVVGATVPELEDLGLPEVVAELSLAKRGLILVTGPAGSGKSTTLAAMINQINKNKSSHIITLEDPIEFLHKHDKSIVEQREIGKDTKNFRNALRAVLREDPDVILIGEMRDLDTISIALTAAETGHLVLSTLHTIGVAKTINRLVDVYPPHQQQQVKIQLASVLNGIVSQQLVPSADGKSRVCATETMVSTTAIQNMIREGKTYQIESALQTGSKYGMKTMDMSIVELYKKKLISYEDALSHAVDREMLIRLLSL
jgi:twitching motility protein PilT